MANIEKTPVKRFPLPVGNGGIEFYFLEETPDRIREMGNGNANKFEPRDLSMGKKEYWETRPSPAKPHHWRPDEFAAHLTRHQYPAGTIADRIRGHQSAICKGLVAGKFVPAEVMATDVGQAALTDALIEVKSCDEGAFRTAQQNQAATQFRAAVGFSEGGIANSVIERLVIDGVKLAAQAKGAKPQAIVIKNYPRPVWCVAVGDRVLIKDSGWNVESLYGTMFEVDRDTAESIVRNAIQEGDLTFDESLWFMGRDWTPFTVVQRCGPGPSP